MDMAIENTLDVMVKTKSTKCTNWSAFEHFLLLPSSKTHNLTFEVQIKLIRAFQKAYKVYNASIGEEDPFVIIL